jgi:hypothetical protein
VECEFVIKDWSAWAPGVPAPADWRRWARRPSRPAGCAVPDLADMPALSRRRLDPLGRMAAQVAWWCQRDDLGMPVVLASRYGDAARSVDLLAALAREEPLSPTAFGLSVHNAIGAVYAIARHARANQVAVAAGEGSAAAAVVEAVGLLHDGAGEVMLVCYDAPLPGAYAVFEDGPAAAFAWAWRMARPAANEARIRLEARPSGGPRAPEPGTAASNRPASDLPFGLDVLRFMLGNAPALERTAEGTTWRWSRHG